MADLNSIVYIDQTLYANEDDHDAGFTWRNDEVLTMLREIRALILSDVEPTLDMQQFAPGSVERAEAALEASLISSSNEVPGV